MLPGARPDGPRTPRRGRSDSRRAQVGTRPARRLTDEARARGRGGGGAVPTGPAPTAGPGRAGGTVGGRPRPVRAGRPRGPCARPGRRGSRAQRPAGQVRIAGRRAGPRRRAPRRTRGRGRPGRHGRSRPGRHEGERARSESRRSRAAAYTAGSVASLARMIGLVRAVSERLRGGLGARRGQTAAGARRTRTLDRTRCRPARRRRPETAGPARWRTAPTRSSCSPVLETGRWPEPVPGHRGRAPDSRGCARRDTARDRPLRRPQRRHHDRRPERGAAGAGRPSRRVPARCWSASTSSTTLRTHGCPRTWSLVLGRGRPPVGR